MPNVDFYFLDSVLISKDRTGGLYRGKRVGDSGTMAPLAMGTVQINGVVTDHARASDLKVAKIKLNIEQPATILEQTKFKMKLDGFREGIYP